MEKEFAKKVGRETFEKLSQETQAVILQCFDHQRWLETEQAKLEYIYSLAQLHPVYVKQKNGLAEQAEQKIQRAFETLVLEGGTAQTSITSSSNGASNAISNGGDSSPELSLAEDLELSLEGF
ncbi:MAG: hypothetical protein AAGD25_21720 [Cyanobacteria bacterium P01_F01_bin.150]